MSRNFKAISITHQNTPLGIREKVALNETECRFLMSSFEEYTDAEDLLILSTCNRTEIYLSSEKTTLEEAVKLLCLQKNISNPESIIPYINHMSRKDEAVLHLFRVALGLDSSVIGDMQILNQVKKAYQLSADKNLAGPFLHRLMHSIFFTNKRVVQETPFRDGSASISYLAADLASDLIKKVQDPRILVLGVGDMGSDVCRNLSEMLVQNVTVLNRTEQKAKEIALECGFNHLPFDQLKTAIKEADLVISSVNSSQPIITEELMAGIRINHKVFIDLSVPRSVDSEVEQLNGVLVYNVDELEAKASEAHRQRLASVSQVESIIEENIDDFNEWSKEMIVSPTINKLKSALEEIRKNEISRHLKTLNEEEARKMEVITKNIMQKIIKLPALELKAACKRGEAETLIDVLNDLFDLERQKESSQ
jgi:glutamyl-tRNA reductase